MNRILLGIAALLSLTSAACVRSARYYIDSGNKFAAEGKYDDAVIRYRKAIQKDGQSGEAYYQLGLAELQREHGPEAFVDLSRAIQLSPNRADIQVKLADLSFAGYVGDATHPKVLYDKVASLADSLLVQDPKSYDGLRLKGDLAMADKKFKEAQEFFRKANDVKADQPALILSWAQALFQDSQPEAGEKLALQLIDKNKSYGPMYDVLYHHYRSLNRLADAENILKTKVSNNPSDSRFLMQLAVFYSDTSRPDEMNAIFQRMQNNPKTYPEAHLEIGDFYLQKQRWDEAVQQFQQGSEADPKQKSAYLKRIADARLHQGKGEQVGSVVMQILKDEPNNKAAQGVRASLLLADGKPENVAKAISQFQALAEKNPNDPIWRFNLGRALLKKGDTAGAQAQFQLATKDNIDFLPPRISLAEMSMAKQDYRATLRYTGEILAVDPQLPAVRLQHAISLVNTGKEQQGRTELTNLQKDFPQSQEVQFQLAVLDLKERKFKDAEDRFRKLTLADAGNARYLTGLVESLGSEGQFDKALSVLEDMLKKTADSANAHSLQVRVLLADTAVAAGKYDLAIDNYKELLRRNGKSVPLYLALGKAHRLKGDASSAVQDYQIAAALAPKDPAPLSLLGEVQELSGQTQEAIESYHRAYALNPDNVALTNNLAFLMAENGGNLDEALRLAQQAVQKLPNQPNFADTLGYVYLKKNLNDSAIQVFRGLAKKYPNDSSFHYHFGLALMQTGDKARARSELAAALSNHPAADLRRKIETAIAKIS